MGVSGQVATHHLLVDHGHWVTSYLLNSFPFYQTVSPNVSFVLKKKKKICPAFLHP